MASVLRNVLDRIYPKKDHSVKFLGLDYSGKTTLLYHLKLKETFPMSGTIGNNVETIDVPLPTGQVFRMTGWDIGGGCSSTEMMLKLGIQIYVLNPHTDALIWVFDAADKERIRESVEMFKLTLSMLDNDLGMNRSKFPYLILANKSDKPNALSLDEIRKLFANATSGRLASIYKTAVNEETKADYKASGMQDALAWLNLAIDIYHSSLANPTSTPAPAKNVVPNQRAPNVLAQKLESWVQRSETEDSPDEFLAKFNTLSLPSWDHYTHIRIAYIILVKYGRQEGKNIIFKGLERYITNSPQTKERSFHLSMTYFWIQIVHLGIRNTPPTPSPPLPSATDVAPKAQLDEFTKFLLINPHVVDGNLWSEFYSKEVLMSPKARKEMVLPDKKPLPNLVARDAIGKFGA